MNIYIVQSEVLTIPAQINSDRNKMIELCKKRYVDEDINIFPVCNKIQPYPYDSQGNSNIYSLGTSLLSLWLADVVVFGIDYERDTMALMIESICKQYNMPRLYTNDEITQLIKADENTNNCSTDCSTEKPIEKVLTEADLVKHHKTFNYDTIRENCAYTIIKNNEEFEVLVTNVGEYSISVNYLAEIPKWSFIFIDEVRRGDVKISKSLIDGDLTKENVIRNMAYIDETAVEVGATYLVEFDYGNAHHAFIEKLSKVQCRYVSHLKFGDSDNPIYVFAEEISKYDNFQMRKVENSMINITEEEKDA